MEEFPKRQEAEPQSDFSLFLLSLQKAAAHRRGELDQGSSTPRDGRLTLSRSVWSEKNHPSTREAAMIRLEHVASQVDICDILVICQ